MSKKMNPLILIPSRMKAKRFPGKPLVTLFGKPMILHVLESAHKTPVSDIWVAAGDVEIDDAVQKAGFLSILTNPDHPSGSDRIWEALSKIDPQAEKDIIINIQGDLPQFDGKIIDALLHAFKDPHVDMVTPVVAFEAGEDVSSPDRVKAVVTWDTDSEETGRILYFSRSVVPFGASTFYHHVGIYAYRRAALEKFINLPESPLEKAESLEQLRAIEAGMHIQAVKIDVAPLSIDTAQDLENFVNHRTPNLMA